MSEFLQEEEALGKAYDVNLMSRLWHYVRPYGWQVALTLLLVIPLFLLELMPAWLIATGLDHAIGTEAEPIFVPESSGTLWGAFKSGAMQLYADGRGWLREAAKPPEGWSIWTWLVIVYFVGMISQAALQFCHMLLMALTGQAAMRDLRRDVFAKLMSLHTGYFEKHPVGRLVTRATNDVENVAEMFTSGIVALVTDIAKMLGFALVLFAIEPELALPTFAVVPFLAVAAVMFRFKVREAFRRVRVRIARINAHIQETITGMKVVQLFGREGRNARDFDAMNADHRDAWQQSIRYDGLLFSSVEAAQGLTVAVIVWIGTGLAEAGALYIFIDYMRRFFMPLRDLSQKYSVMQSSMASAERIFLLLDTEPAIRDPELPTAAPARAPNGAESGLPQPAHAGDIARPAHAGDIEFDHVWFAYQKEDWVLRDVSFRVAPGEKAAFVGATGAGKTTIIALLTRLYEIQRGAIRIDGIDIREMTQHDLRRRIATVLQDVFLFSGSLADNIDLGRDDVSREEVEAAARAVQVDPFIRQLPQGYDTPVHERGTNFSSGQRQLLSFARALVHGADILVLDEATSAIDTETELLLQHGVHVLMEGRTSLAIAHRLSTIRDVDRIHVLEKGRLVESGSHDELLAARGAYHRLYRLQYQEQEVLGQPDELAAAEAAPS